MNLLHRHSLPNTFELIDIRPNPSPSRFPLISNYHQNSSLPLFFRTSKHQYFRIAMSKPILKKNSSVSEIKPKSVSRPWEKRASLKRGQRRGEKKECKQQKKQGRNIQCVKKKGESVYQSKLKSYKQYISNINITLGLIYQHSLQDSQNKFLFFLGPGNNSKLILYVFSKRHWWKRTDSKKTANFSWTQRWDQEFFKRQADAQEIINPNQYEHQKPKSFSGKQKGYGKILSHKEIQVLQSISCSTLGHPFLKLSLQLLSRQRLQNHLQCGHFLGDKCALMQSLKVFYKFKGVEEERRIPRTLILKTKGDREFSKVEKELSSGGIWILKPGQNSNRGAGIILFDHFQQIKSHLLHSKHDSFVIQRYILAPFLYRKRKFDIRHYMLLTSCHGRLKTFWYNEGYLRTSGSEFSLQNLNDIKVHLTNDAIQKKQVCYGKHEKGNKVSYSQFQSYLDSLKDSKRNFQLQILPRLKLMGREAVQSTAFRIERSRKNLSFQLLGLDFMITQQFQPLLIEINTNPCLQCTCPVLRKIVPQLVQNLFRLVVDPLFPPLADYKPSQEHLIPDTVVQKLGFELLMEYSGWEQGRAHSKDLEEALNFQKYRNQLSKTISFDSVII